VTIAEPYGAESLHSDFLQHFYVYQYATSMIGGMSLAEDDRQGAVKSGRAAEGRDAYLRMLKAGSSKYPIELLRTPGST